MKRIILSMILVFIYTTSGIAKVGMVTRCFENFAPLIAYGTFRAYQNQRLATNANNQVILCNQRIQQATNRSQATQASARQQILQQQNRLASQRVQRMSQQQILRTQLLQSQHIQPVFFASQAEQKKNEVSRVPAKAEEGCVGKSRSSCKAFISNMTWLTLSSIIILVWGFLYRGIHCRNLSQTKTYTDDIDIMTMNGCGASIQGGFHIQNSEKKVYYVMLSILFLPILPIKVIIAKKKETSPAFLGFKTDYEIYGSTSIKLLEILSCFAIRWGLLLFISSLIFS